jgi:F-type H+-transporting ATPase subunit alpha
MDNVPVDKARDFEKEFLQTVNVEKKEVLDAIRKGAFGDAEMQALKDIANSLAKNYKA